MINLKKYLVPVFSLLILLSCNRNSENKEELFFDIDSLISTENKELNPQESINHLDSLVMNYSSADRHSYPYDSVWTKSAFIILKDTDTLEYYITLLMLKKYRFQMECCNQGYELRNLSLKSNTKGLDTLSNPVLYEFLKFSNSFDKKGYTIDSLLLKPIEFMNSSMILDWLDKKPKYLEYPRIKSEYEQIIEINKKNNG